MAKETQEYQERVDIIEKRKELNELERENALKVLGLKQQMEKQHHDNEVYRINLQHSLNMKYFTIKNAEMKKQLLRQEELRRGRN